jgi:curved DNA-binding protein CbpA
MNPYEVLGVETTASDSDIRAAYRKKVKETHPDVGGSAEAFDTVQKAYEILSVPARRKHYDSTGSGDSTSYEQDQAEQTLENVFRSTLEAFSAMPVGEVFAKDFIAQLKRTLEMAKKALQVDLKHAQEVRSFMALFGPRLQRKDGRPILEEVLREEQLLIGQAIAALTHNIKIIDLSVALASNYTFLRDMLLTTRRR